jgi:transcriptional regulator with XRE-family HTH domain
VSFYNKFIELCNKKGVKPSPMLQSIGIQKSANTNWKNRKSKPTRANLQKIADYFGVTVEYLNGEEDEATKKPLSENEEWLNNLYNMTKDLSESDKIALNGFIAGLKANRKP